MHREQLVRYLGLAGLLQIAGCTPIPAQAHPNLFGIYTATLDGQNVKMIVNSDWQEMTHARVSPDNKWIVFTRFNDRDRDGLATEEHGYGNTEIVICRIDGSDQQTVIPPKPGVVNANASWNDGGNTLMWVTTDTLERSPQIWKIDIGSRQRTRVPTPADLATSDPNQVGGRLVFPVKKAGEFDTIYSMNQDGTELRQISNPRFPADMKKGQINPGDYDPKLSPDGRKVAFMRLFGKEGWNIIVENLDLGEERNLSGPDRIEALPEWSSDGEWLLFRHIDRGKFQETGVHIMKPDGSARRMVPLPRGYLHNHPQFWPGTGSGPDAKIIYVARHYPGLP